MNFLYLTLLLALCTFASAQVDFDTDTDTDTDADSEHNSKTLECDMCVTFVKEAENFISEKQTELFIMKYLKNNVCSKLPNLEQSSCNMLVEELPGLIVDLIDEFGDANDVCNDMGMC